MNIRSVLNEIEYQIGINGSCRTLAKHWKISTQYLCDIRKGRRQPGPAVLKAMGLKCVTTYTKVYKKVQP